MLSVNRRAQRIVEEMVRREEELKIRVKKLGNGATVIDAGVEVPGSVEAGIAFSEICMGGLGKVEVRVERIPWVFVRTDFPLISCMASQYAGWAVKVEKYFAMGSGPARALARVEKLFEELGYKDESEVAVLTLETRKLPDERVAEVVAQRCGVKPENLTLVVAPTASLVGSIQISARVVETGVHKLHEVGFPLQKIVSGLGKAPIAPVAKNDLEAMGKTNDCVLYGGRTVYFVEAEDEEVERVIEQVPSSSSRDYGVPFLELFERYQRDFFKIDPKLFSPAEIFVNNLKTGRVFHAGKINEEVLEKSLGLRP
ncbi:MAG: methenyltetrahydromethanopterin cyclohydrolase [Hadesarchaea archaeon]|nr:MAG: methenyltetrahydromethanopterin cyclohydrolase [Hadesarchaea archaeon]